MSNKCAICNKIKGKRGCKIHNGQLICPRCCGDIRGSRCEGCQYYQAAIQYQAAKEKAKEPSKFIIELNEEIDAAVDQAMAAVEKRNFSKAQKILDNLMQDHPRYHMVLYGMGVLYAMQGEYAKAIGYFKDAVTVFPIFLEAYYNLAVAYKNIFDVANMVRSFIKVIELAQPGSKYYDNAQSMIKGIEQLMRQNDGLGLEAFINGQDQFDQAFNLMEKGNWKDAIKGFERAIRWYPTLPQPYSNMGICYAKLGKKQDALAAFNKALEIDPKYEPAILNKEATEQLEDGQCLSAGMKTTRYYGQVALGKGSITR